MFPDLAACPNETLIMQQQSNLSCSQKNPLCWEMVRVLTLWWQRFETVQCIMSPDAEKLAKNETIRLFIVCAWKTKLEKLQLVPALRFSYLYGQINEWKCSLRMYGRLVLLVSRFMASGAKASLRCLMRSRIRTEPWHPAATSRSCEPSFAVQQTPSAGHPWELAASDGGVGGFPYFLLPAASCWRRNESKQWVKAAVRMEWGGRWYGTCHQVSVRRAVAKAVSVPEPGTDYRWLRCCMQLFFSLCCDNTKGRAAWWIDCWAGTCELSAFCLHHFFPSFAYLWRGNSDICSVKHPETCSTKDLLPIPPGRKCSPDSHQVLFQSSAMPHPSFFQLQWPPTFSLHEGDGWSNPRQVDRVNLQILLVPGFNRRAGVMPEPVSCGGVCERLAHLV